MIKSSVLSVAIVTAFALGVFAVGARRTTAGVEAPPATAAASAHPTSADAPAAHADTYRTLLQRVRKEPLLEANDPKFPTNLISGERRFGFLMFSAIYHDPINPHILDDDLADWVLSARAGLLLSYAKLVTTPDAPRPYTGLAEDARLALVQEDAAERTRIKQIVQNGGYAESWKPFVAAYGSFAEAAEQAVPPGDTPEPDFTTTLRLVAGIARDHGLFRLARGLPVEPADVTNEILRIQQYFRKASGVANDGDGGAQVLYTCGSRPVAVHVRPWHELAPAFFNAWEAVDKKSKDARAALIVTMFDTLAKDINSWAIKNPEADSFALDKELNRLASDRGWVKLVKQYGARETAKSSDAPASTSPSQTP